MIQDKLTVGIYVYYIPITGTTLELSVFWPSDIEKPDQRTKVF